MQADIEWSVITHEHRERTADWYWALALLAVGGAAISIYFGNLLLAVILLLGLGSIGYLSARGPREHMVRVEKRGVVLDGTLYPFGNIHSFWVEEELSEPTLFLTTSGILAPRIAVPLDNSTHAAAVRTYLREQHVQEEEQQPHFGEHIAALFGL